MLSILTVNIGAAALPRAEALLGWLARRDDDVFLLTETSNGLGTAYLCDRFRRAGWFVQHQPDPDGDRGAALISKIPIVSPATPGFGGVSIPGRLVMATLDTSPQVTVIGTYVPSRDRSAGKTAKKQRFIESLLAALDYMQVDQRATTIIGGDYNVIARNHQPHYPGFLPFEYGLLDALDAHGFVDAHASLSHGRDVYSWIGRTGDGYRYDYFHVGSGLFDRITNCTYLHDTRHQRLTDHAAVTLTVEVDIIHRHEVSALAQDQAALF